MNTTMGPFMLHTAQAMALWNSQQIKVFAERPKPYSNLIWEDWAKIVRNTMSKFCKIGKIVQVFFSNVQNKYIFAVKSMNICSISCIIIIKDFKINWKFSWFRVELHSMIQEERYRHLLEHRQTQTRLFKNNLMSVCSKQFQFKCIEWASRILMPATSHSALSNSELKETIPKWPNYHIKFMYGVIDSPLEEYISGGQERYTLRYAFENGICYKYLLISSYHITPLDRFNCFLDGELPISEQLRGKFSLWQHFIFIHVK